MQQQHEQFASPTGTDVDLEFFDGKWFVAVRRSGGTDLTFTHQREGDGYFSPADAARAAVDLAISRGLTVPTESELIEMAEEFRRWVDGEDRTIAIC